MPQSLLTSQTPVVGNASDGTPGITTATTLQFAEDGTITHVRFWCPTSTGGTWTGAVWEITAGDTGGAGAGNLLGSAVFAGTPTPDAFNQIALSPPVAVEAGKAYRVGIHNNQGRYVATVSFFVTPLVVGDITAEANNATIGALGPIRQGSFKINASLAYPQDGTNGALYFADVVYVPESEGGGDDVEGVASLTLPALASTGAGTVSVLGSAALNLPALSVSGTAGASAVGSGALTLPALDVVATGTSDGEEAESVIPGSYRAIVLGMREALAGTVLRVVDSPADQVVVIGPPTFTWEGLCDVDEPTSLTFPVYLIEALHERAIERLLANLPTLIRALQRIQDATIVQPATPGAFPSGTSDLPCYQLTVEMTL